MRSKVQQLADHRIVEAVVVVEDLGVHAVRMASENVLEAQVPVRARLTNLICELLMRETVLRVEQQVLRVQLGLRTASVRPCDNPRQGAGLSQMEACRGANAVRKRVVALGAHGLHAQASTVDVTDTIVKLVEQRHHRLNEPSRLPLSDARNETVRVSSVGGRRRHADGGEPLPRQYRPCPRPVGLGRVPAHPRTRHRSRR